MGPGGECSQFSMRQRLDFRRGETENADRARDVFYRLLAEIGKGQRQLVPDLIVRGAGDAHPARLTEGLQAGGDVHAVAEDVVAFDDDVANVDPDAEDDAVRLGDDSIAGDHAALDHDRTTDGVDDAREFDERPIAGGLDDAAVVSRDRWVD